MSIRTALIICPAEDNPWIVERRLLGITVGDRLLLALQAAGVKRVAYVGDGPKPTSSRADVEIVSAQEWPSGEEESAFTLLAADTVFDRRLLESAEPNPRGLALKCLPAGEWSAVTSAPAEWLERLGPGAAESGNGFAVRVTDPESARAAENALMLSLYKPADGVISRNLNRKISTTISRRLARYPIKPNHVTAVVFLIGVCAGPFAFFGSYWGFALGGFCYWFSAVLDGCDGEISRLKYLGTKLGAWLDTIVDDMVCLSYLVGMYLGLARGAEHPYWLWIGGGAVGFFLFTILPRYYLMATQVGAGDHQQMARETRNENPSALSRVALKVREVIFRTDFLPFYAMVTAAAGLVPAFALPFAIGSIASFADTAIVLKKYLS